MENEKFIVNYANGVEVVELNSVDEVVQFIQEHIPNELYDEMLDDTYGDVEICGYTYSSSGILKHIDRIAYDCGFDDYVDSLGSDIESDICTMQEEDTIEIYDCEVTLKSSIGNE